MQEKIDNLIAKVLSGNASPDEQLALRRWVEASPSNAGYYAETEKLWRVSGSLKRKETITDIDAAWKEFRSLAGTARPEKARTRTVIFRAAAAFFFFIVTAVLLVLIWPSDENSLAVSHSVELYADTLVQQPSTSSDELKADTLIDVIPVEPLPVQKARKQRRQSHTVMIAVSSEDSAMVFTLPDQTKVYLNKFSKLTYPEQFSGIAKQVYLSGEAYFETAGGADFFVYCDDTRIRSMGSAFNVRGMRDGIVEVSAITGDVEVNSKHAGSQLLILEEGQQAVYKKSSQQLVKNKMGKKDRWWKRGGFRAFIRNFFYRIIHPRDSGQTERN